LDATGVGVAVRVGDVGTIRELVIADPNDGGHVPGISDPAGVTAPQCTRVRPKPGVTG
jgi:hypothetical protein